MNKGDWFIEEFGQAGALSFKVDEILFEGQSPYQKVTVVRNLFFGNVMLLDDLVMVTDKDEFFYHDMLVHVPMVCADNPENVLIIGGGDGGSVREVLKHGSVKKVVLCEIDGMVIDVAKKYFPDLSSCLDDKRVDVVVADGIKYIKDHKNEFDCICIDSTDPIGPAVGLFTAEFYGHVKAVLRQGGVMSAQTESPAWSIERVAGIMTNIKKGFGNAHLYLCPIPCYPSGLWSFAIAMKSDKNPVYDFNVERSQKVARQCKYYNPEIHKAAFCLPNFIRDALK